MFKLVQRYLSQLASNRNPSPKAAGRRKLSVSKRPDVTFAIGDVHGRHDLLVQLENQIIKQTAGENGSKLIVMLGDYVDRGLHSRQVIDRLLSRPPDGFERICLAGNHEHAMLAFFANPAEEASWLNWGGLETLASYGITSEQLTPRFLRSKMMRNILDSHIPEEHIDFLTTLPSLLTMPGYVFAHAGIRPGVPIEQQSDSDLLWIRDEFFEADSLGISSRVVHGHTPGSDPVISPTRICVDTGAYATDILTALKISEVDDISFITSK